MNDFFTNPLNTKTKLVRKLYLSQFKLWTNEEKMCTNKQKPKKENKNKRKKNGKTFKNANALLL